MAVCNGYQRCNRLTSFAEPARSGQLRKLWSVLQISFLAAKTPFAGIECRPPPEMKLERLNCEI
jgi:hypothetical protein